MKEFLAVFIGGGIGSLARYGLNQGMSEYSFRFPVATLMVNILSCLIAGIVVSFIEQKFITSSITKTFLLVGFCGGFSTFSTLIRESLLLLEENRAGPMLFYTVCSVIFGLLAIVTGIWMGKFVIR